MLVNGLSNPFVLMNPNLHSLSFEGRLGIEALLAVSSVSLSRSLKTHSGYASLLGVSWLLGGKGLRFEIGEYIVEKGMCT